MYCHVRPCTTRFHCGRKYNNLLVTICTPNGHYISTQSSITYWRVLPDSAMYCQADVMLSCTAMHICTVMYCRAPSRTGGYCTILAKPVMLLSYTAKYCHALLSVTDMYCHALPRTVTRWHVLPRITMYLHVPAVMNR